jgi:hypothetical protein
MPSNRRDLDTAGHAQRLRAERLTRPKGTATVEFLQRLGPNRSWVLTAIIPDGGTLTRTFDNVEAARRFIVEQNSAGNNVYYSINPTKTALKLKASKQDIARVEYLQVDADPGPDETPEDFKARLRPRIEAYRSKPTFVIDSGNGLQLLWRLQRAIEINGDEVIEDIEARNHALALAFQAAPSTRNIDRIFRLPGTINFPNRRKRELGRTRCRATLLEYNKVAYPLSDFPPHRAPTTSTPNNQTRTRTTPELTSNLRTLLLTEGSGGYPTRSELLFAFLTRAIRAGLPDSLIIEACLDETYRGKGIYQHIANNGGRQCAGRQLQRAYEKIAESRSGSNSPHTWEDPDLSISADRRPSELPKFPLEVFRKAWFQTEWSLQNFAKRAAHGAGTTVDHVMVPFLGIASSMIGAARRVEASKSFSEPMSCWAAMVGRSGTGKTPGLDATRKPLNEVEHDRKEEHARLKRAHDERVQRAAAAKKKWEAEVKEAVKKNKTTPAKPKDAEDPGDWIEPRLYTSDTTIEKVTVLLQARPQGSLLLTDELAGWFHNMSRYSGGQDNQFWLMSWDGRPYRVDRMSRPAIDLEHLLVAVVGGVQPDKLGEMFEGAADGMSARFLYAWPDEPPYRKLTDKIGQIDDKIVEVLDRLSRLRKLGHNRVPLSQRARDEFEKLRKEVHDKGQWLDGREHEWWSKVPSQVLRLAGTLAYVRWAIARGNEPRDIKWQYVAAAVRLVRDYFWPHSQAALRQIGLSQRHADARRVLRWIAAQQLSQVSREDIRRRALGQTRDADQTQSLINNLTRAGWLRRRTLSTGGRPSVRYEVNPRLKQTLQNRAQ